MKKIVSISIWMVVMTSCLNDFLEVEPLSDISTEIYWQTEKDVRAALNAAYAHLQSAYATGFLNWCELRSDNFLGPPGGTIPMQNVSFNNLTSSMPYCNWNNWYTMISVANYAIYFIPEIKNVMAEERQNHLLSEAYFLRAFAYFNLYRIWGDAPLITEPVLKKSDVYKPFKTEKSKIMELINADLEQALLLVDNYQEEVFLYSAGALYALCTDVAMWNHDYDKAIACSQQLFDLMGAVTPNRYSIHDVDFSLVCADAQTTDNIWTLKWSYVSNGGNSNVMAYYNNAGPVPTRVIYEKWQSEEDRCEVRDERRLASIDSSRISVYTANHVNRIPQISRIWKWTPGVRAIPEDVREASIPLYRLADIILLRAEAFNQKGLYQEAIDEMNRVRLRAGLTERTLFDYMDEETQAVSPGLIEDDILQERQFELLGEGKRWFDLMRTGRLMAVMNDHYDGYITTYGGTGFSRYTEEWQLYWPVSQDVLNENENLSQTGNY